MTRILVIEDETGIVEGLRDAFGHHGFEMISAGDGERGYELVLSTEPELIVLDLMLPKLDGMELCRRLRNDGIRTPIIMLTARGEETDRVAGLELGADDYVTKPFSVRELIARAKAVLRRFAETPNRKTDEVVLGEARLNLNQYLVSRGEGHSKLTSLEVKLLRYLLSHPNEAVSREDLLDQIWGYKAFPTTRTVDTFIYRLRKKIESDPEKPKHLITVHGVGYKLVP